ncbi:TPA: 6-carboxyhexanoate--CoA ligase, partial [Corynebacterium striatum]|nr:6-carboxyhexanoate--CoA ligase [Corynebacterium striatum]HCG3161309.1 6-carboxyhexanoate--CoA ligase [Corynebacterium striatum]HDV8347028.1 6-carboxyhexanoate--CoA ligase [Corynebacterium striatum]
MLGYDTCMAETSTVLMSIKMRASLEGRHISGAERIVEPHLV